MILLLCNWAKARTPIPILQNGYIGKKLDFNIDKIFLITKYGFLDEDRKNMWNKSKYEDDFMMSAIYNVWLNIIMDECCVKTHDKAEA